VWLGPEEDPNFPNPTATFIGGPGNDTVHVLNFEATVVDFSKGGNDIVDLHSGVTGEGLLSNNPAVDGSSELHNSVTGWTTANDTIHITNLRGNVSLSLNFTNGGVVLAGATTSILNFTTGAVVDGSATPDNWIKINTPTATLGDTADTGFDSAIGADGSIHTAAGDHFYLASFYDSTHGQAVFGATDSNRAGDIDDTSSVEVVGLIHMSAADYAAMGPSNLHFT
jgi:hypothetical protein